jgi:hypothetical protein
VIIYKVYAIVEMDLLGMIVVHRLKNVQTIVLLQMVLVWEKKVVYVSFLSKELIVDKILVIHLS